MEMKKKPVNAMDAQFFTELGSLLHTLEENDKCRGLILTSVWLPQRRVIFVRLCKQFAFHKFSNSYSGYLFLQ